MIQQAPSYYSARDFSRRSGNVFIAVVLLLAICCIASSSLNKGRSLTGAQVNRLSRLPRTMIWAWERAENLHFINSRTTGVAFLAGVIFVENDVTQVNVRQQPMGFPETTSVVGVVRIESHGRPSLSENQLEKIVQTVSRVVDLYKPAAIQIDFDAKVSERGFYRNLLKRIRNVLPEGTGLSMTALASWCVSDYWLGDLPVDEIVPMYFSMGIDQRRVLSHLRRNRPLASEKCERASGVMVDGIVAREATHNRSLRARLCSSRLYLFSTRPWSERSFKQTINGLTSWN
jgi:hypothetical protein